MSNDCYSPLKIFHHRERLEAMRDGSRPDLLHLQIVPTNACNQNCSFCAYRSKGYSSSEQFNAHDTIPGPKLLEILRHAPLIGVRAVEITGGGEPTMHPQFSEACDLLRKQGTQYAVVTNGTLLGSKNMHALVGAAWVRFSIDAGRPETYARLRGSYPDTLAVVRSRVSMLRATSPQTVVGVGFVVTAQNWHEVLLAAQNAKADGAHNFRISAVFQNGGAEYFASFYPEARDLCNEVKHSLEDKSFKVFNMFGERINDLSLGQPQHHDCHIQQLVTYIGADLNVYRCCVLAYNERGLLGSLDGQTLPQLWTSIENPTSNFDARECPRCMFNSKNTTIRYAINTNPQHVNFL